MLSEIGLEFRVQAHVGLVVKDEVVLNLGPLRQLHIGIIQRVSIRSHRTFRRSKGILADDGLQRVSRGVLRPELRRRMRPVLFSGLPLLAQAFLVTVAVLGDDGIDAFRMLDGQAHPYGGAVVEDVHCKVLQPKRLGELVHNLGQVVKGIFKLNTGR